MSSKALSKLSILNNIKDKKDILFAAFSEKYTKQNKLKAWQEIHERASGLGLIPPGKDATYTRDTFWQNLKKNTTKKIDNRKKTGSEGGARSKPIDVDNVVLGIIGRESLAVVGLNCSGTWQDGSACDQSRQVIGNDDSTASHLGNSTRPASSRATQMCEQKSSRTNSQDDQKLLWAKKLKLQVELLKKESYLKSLPIFKQERELGIPASHFTKDSPVEAQTMHL
ncbi:hypothetical protein PR048_003665 [Dryococelus australis]|uniref:Regulatory protein zeste n=1 Tax=Dryococelus australis TaxID=614101 RepID=A0ABQ9INS5_9NEOP|nr:hypothetical protein PR048_003665 [Dryococelus australis]